LSIEKGVQLTQNYIPAATGKMQTGFAELTTD